MTSPAAIPPDEQPGEPPPLAAGPAVGLAPVAAAGASSSKADWRRRIRAQRRDRVVRPHASADRIVLARRLADHVLAAPAGLAGVVAAYRSLPTEPPTTVLLHELVRRRRTVLVPELLPDRDLDWRVLGGDARPGDLAGPDAIRRARLVLVPALAVDRFGTRLGQGGGSYDRALARLGPGVPIVALLYDAEALLAAGDPALPREPHDAVVTAVITPGRGWVSLDALAPAPTGLGD